MLIHSPESLAAYAREERKRKKLSQTEAADKVGLARTTLSEFELGADSTKLDTVFRILSSLGLQMTITPKDSSDSSSVGWKEEW